MRMMLIGMGMGMLVMLIMMIRMILPLTLMPFGLAIGFGRSDDGERFRSHVEKSAVGAIFAGRRGR